ncbi:MAG: hypothetical protein HWD86_04100 [Kangiellaceae bacterium]|nr:hypothetical protein [Kangiellaceae bacterium]
MFETIAMICYLSMVEPQFDKNPVASNVVITDSFTGGGGQEPDDNPKKTKTKEN